MAWKPEVFVEKKWSHNGLVFATKDEAEENAKDLFMRWTSCDGWRAVMSNDTPNYTYVGGELKALPEVASEETKEE